MTDLPTPPADLEGGQTLKSPVRPAGGGASLIGQMLGEYEVEAHLGAGGMGIVYRGVQPQIGKRVAIKVLRPEIASGQESVQALLAEARAVNAIRHSGIVDIFSFGATADGSAYVVMELLEGSSLDVVLHAVHRFSPVQAIDILSQMLTALDAAHTAGVIHRDLKPANLHLGQQKDGSWRVKILDFGLAKLTAPGGGGAAQTHSQLVRGTPQYMAPEQARAQPVSPATDCYAVGVIAFEMLTARLPFEATNVVDLLLQLVSVPAPRLRSIDESMPAALDELIFRLLSKEPGDRPASALEVRRELLRIRADLLKANTVVRKAPLRHPHGLASATQTLTTLEVTPMPAPSSQSVAAAGQTELMSLPEGTAFRRRGLIPLTLLTSLLGAAAGLLLWSRMGPTPSQVVTPPTQAPLVVVAATQAVTRPPVSTPVTPLPETEPNPPPPRFKKAPVAKVSRGAARAHSVVPGGGVGLLWVSVPTAMAMPVALTRARGMAAAVWLTNWTSRAKTPTATASTECAATKSTSLLWATT